MHNRDNHLAKHSSRWTQSNRLLFPLLKCITNTWHQERSNDTSKSSSVPSMTWTSFWLAVFHLSRGPFSQPVCLFPFRDTNTDSLQLFLPFFFAPADSSTGGNLLHPGYGSYPAAFLQNGAGMAAAVTSAAALAARIPNSYYPPIIYWPYPSPPVSPTTYAYAPWRYTLSETTNNPWLAHPVPLRYDAHLPGCSTGCHEPHRTNRSNIYTYTLLSLSFLFFPSSSLLNLPLLSFASPFQPKQQNNIILLPLCLSKYN